MDSQESADFKHNKSVLNTSQKRHIYILNDETQVDPQNEQVSKYKNLGANINFDNNGMNMNTLNKDSFSNILD